MRYCVFHLLVQFSICLVKAIWQEDRVPAKGGFTLGLHNPAWGPPHKDLGLCFWTYMTYSHAHDLASLYHTLNDRAN